MGNDRELQGRMKYEVGVGVWLADARVVLKSGLARLARQFSLAEARVWLRGRLCCAKSAKDKICFARFAAQTLLASNFCLARQKSPKSRGQDADIAQESRWDRLNGDFEYAFVNARSRLSDNT